jgi:hypothetical protein
MTGYIFGWKEAFIIYREKIFGTYAVADSASRTDNSLPVIWIMGQPFEGYCGSGV